MKLSIIIVNYNVKHFLEQCLHSVFNALKGIKAEVFVVDNNSVDGSVQWLSEKFSNVVFIENTDNVGFSRANNQAIKIANGEYVLLLNPDTVVEENTFRKIIDFMDLHPEAGGLGVKMIDGKGNFLPESKRGLPTPSVAFYKMFGLASIFPHSKLFGKYHLSYLPENEIHEVEILAGAFMLLRKSVLDRIGLLDETFFMYGEDIDLSYRIIKAGYKNYYFPETTIIHYKGESTKKGSLNYVKVFYNAMIIFARKHFSTNQAGIFIFLIHLAVWFRAFISVVQRIAGKLLLPFMDAVAVFSGYLIFTPVWEKLMYEPGYYPPRFLNIAVPIYIALWLMGILFSGGYRKPIDLYKVIRGLFWGTIAILLLYSLVDENFRFSRFLILSGFIWSVLVLMTYRIILHWLKIKGFRIEYRKLKRIAVTGSMQEAMRVKKLIEETQVKTDFAGFIFTDNTTNHISNLGNIRQLREIVRINRVEEIVFCAESLPMAEIIKSMLDLSNLDIDYKIAPPQGISVIGSNSIHTAGELYVLNVNAISKNSNRVKKRVADILVSIFFLVFLPVSILVEKNKIVFLKNCFRILGGKLSWVGYTPEKATHQDLPAIKPGVLNPCSMFSDVKFDLAKKININSLYARDYHILTDLEIIIKNIGHLG